jgi:hypothetical protein
MGPDHIGDTKKTLHFSDSYGEGGQKMNGENF